MAVGQPTSDESYADSELESQGADLSGAMTFLPLYRGPRSLNNYAGRLTKNGLGTLDIGGSGQYSNE